jgi:hypothetical protein
VTAKQAERLVIVAEKLAVSFSAMVDLMEKRLNADHPPVEEIVDAQVVRVGEGNADQPQSKEEYEEFPIDQPASFEAILAKLKEGS